MITLTILLVLALIGAVVVGTVGISFVAVFGDFIIAALILYGIYKLITKMGSNS